MANLFGNTWEFKVGNKTVQVEEPFFDSAIRTIDPERGKKRLMARFETAMATQYWKGASKSKRSMKKYNPPASDADSSILMDLPSLRERSSDLIRNNTVARGGIAKAVTNIIGTGLTFQSNIDNVVLNMTEDAAETWQDKTESEFHLHFDSETCHAARTLSFNEQQYLALWSAFERGDAFVVLKEKPSDDSPYKLATSLLEGDRCSNPLNKQDEYKEDGSSVIDGVVKDMDGAPTDYWISNFHPGNIKLYRERKWTKIPVKGAQSGRRNILHIFRPTRAGQTRGYPFLSPVIEPLKQLERYTEAELMAAVIGGMFTVFVETENAKGVTGFKPPSGSTAQKGDEDDYELGNGSMVNLKTGEKITVANPGRPNATFDPFTESIIKQIALGLEMPFETLMGVYLSSYSAARAALLDAWKMFSTRRTWFARVFCQPIYEAWLDEAIRMGRISAPGYFADPAIRKAYRGALWVGPGRGMINEKDEVKAAHDRIKAALSTRQRETSSIGTGDYKANMKQLAKEEKFAESIGLDLNKEDNTPAEPPPEPSQNKIDDMED